VQCAGSKSGLVQVPFWEAAGTALAETRPFRPGAMADGFNMNLWRWRPQVMKTKPTRKDLSCPDAQRGYRHATDEFVDWYWTPMIDDGEFQGSVPVTLGALQQVL
jgi:hypothetical protein